MRRPLLVAGGLVAGALVLGAAAPALATGAVGFGRQVVTATCDGTGPDGTGMPGNGFGMRGRGPGGTTGTPGSANGYGMGGMGGGGMGGGMGGAMDPAAGIANLPKGTLSDAQRTALAGMAEEEKLAHDVYVALAAKYPSAYQFARISNAETVHLKAVRALLTRYGITDPTAGKAAGQFASKDVQGKYDRFVAAADVNAAYASGRAVEQDDIAALAAAGAGLTAPDVTRVYANLTRASQMHLRAFGG